MAYLKKYIHFMGNLVIISLISGLIKPTTNRYIVVNTSHEHCCSISYLLKYFCFIIMIPVCLNCNIIHYITNEIKSVIRTTINTGIFSLVSAAVHSSHS